MTTERMLSLFFSLLLIRASKYNGRASLNITYNYYWRKRICNQDGKIGGVLLCNRDSNVGSQMLCLGDSIFTSFLINR